MPTTGRRRAPGCSSGEDQGLCERPKLLLESLQSRARTADFALHSWADLQVEWKLLESIHREVFSPPAPSVMRPLHDNREEVMNSREKGEEEELEREGDVEL